MKKKKKMTLLEEAIGKLKLKMATVLVCLFECISESLILFIFS